MGCAHTNCALPLLLQNILLAAASHQMHGCHIAITVLVPYGLQVKLHCQVRGDLMAEMWQNLCCLTSASLTAGEAAGAKSAACAAANEALWAAMPAVQDAYMR